MLKVKNSETEEISYVDEEEYKKAKKNNVPLINKYKLCKETELVNQLVVF